MEIIEANKNRRGKESPGRGRERGDAGDKKEQSAARFTRSFSHNNIYITTH